MVHFVANKTAMHLFANTHKNCRIHALDAVKGVDYFCIECGKKVRKRGGDEISDHFWHFEPNNHCSLNHKTATHLHLQYYFQKILPKNDCLLECRFPTINRIADVAWVSEKIIFEIQYSPISTKEVKKRNQDYASVGWQVVWILHTKQFNQRRLKGAEHFLQNHPHYYSDMNAKGQGSLFDQITITRAGFRLTTLAKKNVLLTHPLRPRKMHPLRNSWPLHFKEDLLDDYQKQKIRLPPSFTSKPTLTLKQLYKRLIDHLLTNLLSP